MNHKHFAQFLYEWTPAFHKMKLKPQSDTDSIWVNVIMYNPTTYNYVLIETYYYKISTQLQFFNDMKFLEDNFPELKIEYI